MSDNHQGYNVDNKNNKNNKEQTSSIFRTTKGISGCRTKNKRRRYRQRNTKWVEVVSDELIIELSPHYQHSSSITKEEEHFTLANIEHELNKYSVPRHVILKSEKRAIAVYSTVEVSQFYYLCCYLFSLFLQ
jgi:hypothetical protein